MLTGNSYHTLPAMMSVLHEAVGKLHAGNAAAGPTFVARSHPLPLTQEESVQLDSILKVRVSLLHARR